MKHTSPKNLLAGASPLAQRHPTKGAANRAKVITAGELADLVKRVNKTSLNAERDIVAIYLSFHCGLRAQEIAGLEWNRHVLGAKGQFRSAVDPFTNKTCYSIFISGDIGKKGVERTLPLPDKVVQAMQALRTLRPKDKYVFHRLDQFDATAPLTANAVAQWFHRLYEAAGLDGCSSHSGRRYYITNSLRKAPQHNCSVRDVMLMAGHRQLETTMVYADPSMSQNSLVNAVAEAA